MPVTINLNDVQVKPIVVNADLTAVLDRTYTVVASAIFTDPTPTEGKGFIVFVRNGTATVGGIGYSTAGTIIRRVYYSGAWANYTGTSVDVNTIGVAINGASSATPNDTDLVMSVESSVAKKNTWTQIKAFLKTYFDTVYQATGSYLTSANITQTITNGVTDKAPSEDAVYDALALKLGILNKTTSDQTTVTGSTSNVISYSFPISGNSVTVGDILMITARSRYVGTAGGKTIRWYVNTSDSLSGATLLATYAAASNSLSTDLGRVLAVKSTTNSEIIGSGVTTLTGSESNSGTALSSISIDWTVTQYFIEAIQLSNGADSGVVSYSIIRKA